MNYTIDEAGIHYHIEDNEADAVARLLDRRRLLTTEPTMPEIPLADAIKTCQDISAQYAESDCECERIGVKPCGICE